MKFFKHLLTGLALLASLAATPQQIVEYPLNKAEYSGVAEAVEQAPSAPTNVNINAPAPTGGGGPTALNCSDTTTRCVPSEYATINLCAAAATAGDICLVSAGTYTETVNINNSGSSVNNTITFVGAAAPASVIVNGQFNIAGSYVRIIGFTINCSGQNDCMTNTNENDFVEIWNNTCSGFVEFCYAQRGTNQGQNDDSNLLIGNVSNGNILVNNQHFGIFGSHNIAAYNAMNQSGNDFFVFYGPDIRLYNNYGWGPANVPLNGQHSDFAQTGVAGGRTVGTARFMLEANYYKGNPPSTDQHYTNLETTPDFSGTYLSRRNIIFNSEAGLGSFDISPWFVSHDLYIDGNQSSGSCGAGCTGVVLIRTAAPRIYNTGFVDFWGSVSNAEVYYVGDGTDIATDYNFAWDRQLGASMSYFASFAAEANKISTQDPLFVDRDNGDFHLQSSSPMRNSAGPLATVTSSSSTGTTFNITTGRGGFFRGFDSSVSQYSGNLAAGDVITIGTDVRRISSVTNDTITVTSSFTWANGDGVYYGDNSVDNARGPFPYRASWTLSGTYSCNGSTCTTVPSDATITRMVVCFSDRIPYQVVIDSPYTCTDPAGTFEARIYPLYASTTLWAVATP